MNLPEPLHRVDVLHGTLFAIRDLRCVIKDQITNHKSYFTNRYCVPSLAARQLRVTVAGKYLRNACVDVVDRQHMVALVRCAIVTGSQPSICAVCSAPPEAVLLERRLELFLLRLLHLLHIVALGLRGACDRARS